MNNENFNQNNNANYNRQNFENGYPYVDAKTKLGIEKAKKSKTMGIIGLVVGLGCCGIAGIIFAIIGISAANDSRIILGYEHPDAKTGKICAIVALVAVVAGILISLVTGGVAFVTELIAQNMFQ